MGRELRTSCPSPSAADGGGGRGPRGLGPEPPVTTRAAPVRLMGRGAREAWGLSPVTTRAAPVRLMGRGARAAWGLSPL